MKANVSKNVQKITAIVLALLAIFCFSCSKENQAENRKSVAVFVPGLVAGSPIYEMLVLGAQKAVAETEGASIKIIEAGYDQSVWYDSLRDIASSGQYGLIVSSNPSLPEMCSKLQEDYPLVKFVIVDAYLEGKSNIHTVLYNQTEQGYIAGYLAGLVTKNKNPNGKAVAGFVAAQHYPTLDKMILPGYEAGLKAVDPSFSVEFREVGNWFDASKASVLTESIFEAGAEVVLPVAGAAGAGVVSIAKEKGKSVIWFDGSGYKLDPVTVVGCAVLSQEKLVYEKTKEALLISNDPKAESLFYGKAEIVSIKNGYIDFDKNGDGYKNLPENVKLDMEKMLTDFSQGKPDFFIDKF